MKKNIIIIFICLILGVIILNEFVLFSFAENEQSHQSSCMMMQLYSSQENSFSLVEESELILIGTAKKSKWVNDGKTINTHTEMMIDEIIKGSFNGEKIIISSPGGCNLRLNYCVGSSVSANLDEDSSYLLFLSKLNENVYGGFSSCGGIYLVEHNEVYCFAQDIEYCENGKINLDDLKIQIN